MRHIAWLFPVLLLAIPATLLAGDDDAPKLETRRVDRDEKKKR